MSRTVSDFFWDRLSQWGVKTIFGFPGDGINGLLGALNRASPSTSPTVIRLTVSHRGPGAPDAPSALQRLDRSCSDTAG
jgi:thiamine pyrophosphate-dependent acetolactate synthase large subunit-like protein